MLETIFGGLGILFGLAVMIGHVLDRQARDHAWQRIATSRRITHLEARELGEKELALHIREEALDLRERRIEYREHVLLGREVLLEEQERHLRSGADEPPEPHIA